MRLVPPALTSLALCLLCAFTLQSRPVAAQQGQMTPEEEAIYKSMIQASGADPAQVMEAGKSADASRRWTEGKGIVHYHIVGDYQGKTNVIGDPNWIGYADVTDRVVIDLDWNLAESELVGTPIIQNTKAVVKNLRNYEPSCQPPVLKGEYEHYEVTGIKQGLAGALDLQVRTTYPAAEVVQDCTGARKSVAGRLDARPEEMVVPSPVLLGMSIPDSDNLRISPDKKSLIHKKSGWTWTFTPSVKK